MSTILFIISSTLSGPFFPPGQKNTLTILLDSTSPDKEIKRKSLIIKREFLSNERSKERFYVDNYWNIEFKEYNDKPIKVSEIPCFKINKGEWTKFEPLMTAASGIPLLNIYIICRFVDYDDKMYEWTSEDGHTWSKREYNSELLRYNFEIQPPKVPEVKYYDIIFFYKDLFYLEARQYFSKEEFEKLPIEELLENLFYWERGVYSVLSIRSNPFNHQEPPVTTPCM